MNPLYGIGSILGSLALGSAAKKDIVGRVPPSARKIWAWLEKNDLTYDARLYSHREWLTRSEPYGNNSLFTITTEGPLYMLLNAEWDRREDDLADAFRRFNSTLGVYFEQGYAWTLHFYPL
jgi:hypothetical protein